LAVDPLASSYPSWSPYNYTLNNPINATDPDGRWVNFLVGAAVGAATDVAFQMIVEGKSFKDVDVGSVIISAAAGSVGAGIASKGAKLGKFIAKYGDEIVDGTASVAGQLNESGTVDVTDVAIDVAVGKAVSNEVRKATQTKQKVLNRQAHSAEHTAQNKKNKRSKASQDRKERKAKKARSKAKTAAANAAGASVAGSNAASKSVNIIKDEIENE